MDTIDGKSGKLFVEPLKKNKTNGDGSSDKTLQTHPASIIEKEPPQIKPVTLNPGSKKPWWSYLIAILLVLIAIGLVYILLNGFAPLNIPPQINLGPIF